MDIYGLIGHPLTHSWSKQYFSDKFSTDIRMDARYELFDMESLDTLPELIDQNKELAGFNVTIPHKHGIIEFLDELDPLARKINAVNCVKVVRDGLSVSLKGFNTDALGFRESLLPLLQSHHKKALILGSGGSASAVGHVLTDLEINFTSVSRSPGHSGQYTYSDVTREVIQSHTLVINATPLGMYPLIDTFPSIPYKYLSSKHLLYDLVYNPPVTQFIERGIRAGAMTKNGLEMLHLQAEHSWDIWNR